MAAKYERSPLWPLPSYVQRSQVMHMPVIAWTLVMLSRCMLSGPAGPAPTLGLPCTASLRDHIRQRTLRKRKVLI